MENAEQVKKKRRPLKRVILIAGIIILVLGGVYIGYYKWRQNQIILDHPVNITVSCQQETRLKDAAQSWFEALTSQHQQDYIKSSDRIDSYEIDDIKVLEDKQRKIVQIDFSLDIADPNAASFEYWELGTDGDEVSAQWVVTFDVSQSKTDGMLNYKAVNVQRPAAYDLENYNASGQADADALEHELSGQRPYDDIQYTYKIESETCSVSYDGGASWIQTPLPIEQLDYYVDGHFKSNELREGSYIISPEKTALLFGGFHTPLTCLYSDNMGKTWQTIKIDGAPLYCHIKFLSFPTPKDGYIILGSDKTMSWEYESVYKTTDGGATWSFTGEGPRSSMMQSAGFIAPDIGFVSYRYNEGADAMMYRTEDAGVTWEPIVLDIEAELRPYFTQPQTPKWDNEKLVLLVDEGADSDYQGGNPMQLKYLSEDLGLTWTFAGMLELKETEPG